MKAQHLRTPMSLLSVSALLAALVAAPSPAHAEPAHASSTQAEANEESAITDTVLQVGADESSRKLSWMSENSGGGEVRWAKTSELNGSALPDDAESAETTESGLSTDLKRHFNHASMTELEPNTEYSYQVGSEKDGFSDVAQFDTGVAGDDSEFLVFGDPQIGAGGQPDDATGWDRTLNSALETGQDPRFFYSLGDQVNSAGDQGQYEQYLAPEATRTVPQATTIGNHDVASKSYEQHFNRPNVSGDHGGSGAITSGGDYWFIDSGVLFININSNDANTDEHAEFIDEVVAEHGDQARWTVLGFHHSIYSTATHSDDLEVKRLREAIPPVAARNDIDLVVSGHDHIYNRTFLMDAEGKKVASSDAGFEQQKEEGQTMYLTLTSSSGSKFYDYVPGLDWEAKSVHNDVPAFTRVRVSDESLRATTYEVPAEGGTQAASEAIDDVEISRQSDEEPSPDH
ncbi:FN3 domain-containing metallophosphoesterase family protein [Brevibacterium picturae]